MGLALLIVCNVGNVSSSGDSRSNDSTSRESLS